MDEEETAKEEKEESDDEAAVEEEEEEKKPKTKKVSPVHLPALNIVQNTLEKTGKPKYTQTDLKQASILKRHLFPNDKSIFQKQGFCRFSASRKYKCQTHVIFIRIFWLPYVVHEWWLMTCFEF